jgi:hypothetical protein
MGQRRCQVSRDGDRVCVRIPTIERGVPPPEPGQDHHSDDLNRNVRHERVRTISTILARSHHFDGGDRSGITPGHTPPQCTLNTGHTDARGDRSGPIPGHAPHHHEQAASLQSAAGYLHLRTAGICPPRDPTRLLQDSPQEQVRSPRGISVPTLPHCRRLPLLVILLASGRIRRRNRCAPPGGQSVPTLQNSGSTYSPRGRTHHRSCRAVCSHCTPRVPKTHAQGLQAEKV